MDGHTANNGVTMELAEIIRAGVLLDVARAYVSRGLSVIPVRADGSKAPALKAGEVEQYRERYPTDEELVAWFPPRRPVGLAVVCGVISGNLAVMDFESESAWERWLARVTDAGRAGIITTAPIARTPKGGRHVYCRIKEGWVAGTPLAKRARDEILIEIRGQGHYVLAPGCPTACHPLNKPYAWESEGWLAHVI